MHPDVEVILVAYLAGRGDVAALTDQIGTRTPPATSDPWAKVTAIIDTANARSSALHLTHALVQIDCYGSSDHATMKAEASELARTIRAALAAMPAATHTGAVVTAVRDLTIRPLPDDDLTPARERYIVEGTITLHPA